MDQDVSEDRLVRYLLGELSEEEQIQFEAMFFTDESSLEQLLIIEEELINDYLSGDLTKEESERFQNYFLSTSERVERVQFNRELLASIARAEESLKAIPAPARSGWWSQFINSPVGKPALLLPVASAIVILLLGGLWLYVDRARLRTQIDEAQAELAMLDKQRQALDQQIAEQRARSEELAEQLQRNQAEREKLELELSKAQRPQDAIASFILAPAAGSRSPDGKSARIIISPKPRLLRLKLVIDAEADYKSYRAVLRKVGREIMTVNELRSGSSTSGKFINLILPSSVLSAGDYVVTVFGVTDSRSFEEAGNYLFKAVKK